MPIQHYGPKTASKPLNEISTDIFHDFQRIPRVCTFLPRSVSCYTRKTTRPLRNNQSHKSGKTTLEKD